MPDVIRHPAEKIQFYLLMHSNQLTTPEYDVALRHDAIEVFK
ncbi:MAG: hypothetical protein ACREYC_04160 [Gammaproteobacteria bacterium]